FEFRRPDRFDLEALLRHLLISCLRLIPGLRRGLRHAAIAARVAKWHPQRTQQGQPLEIASRCGPESYRQTLNLLDLVEVEFGKNRMFSQPQRVISAPVEGLLAYPVEIAHSRQRDVDEAIEKFP